MSKRYKGSKDKRDSGQYIALPHRVIDSPGYRCINHTARSLLLDIARQYSGNNNGRLVACDKYLKPLGWNSSDTVTRALRNLLEHGLLQETRKGARPNKAAWFALTWYALDVAEGLDIDARQYRTGAYQKASLTASHGVVVPVIAPSHGVRASSATPSRGAIR